LRKQPTFGNYGPLPDRIIEIKNDPTLPVDIKAHRIALRQRYAASMAIPLVIQGEVYGGMVFYYSEPQEFSEEQVQLAMTFADQMALAIENANLYEQAADIAALTERNRLARDLHDAVTQTLFSASLVADVLPKLWERNPELGRQKLEELRMLTRGALSEMRTLLLELRPDTLGDAEPEELLRYLCNAFTGRTHTPVTLNVSGQAQLTSEVKEVLYRIVQESLNNIAKHAGASQVNLDMVFDEDYIEVSIKDNGRGFDLASVGPGNLGLKIMRERAETMGAELNIVSNMGKGTQIDMFWKKGKEKET
jgi:two-component system nitrate/nitrite sensor histidine kinase NarX